MMQFKRVKIFDIWKVRPTREGSYISDGNGQVYYIPRMVEGNVPHDAIHREGRIWLILDIQGHDVLRWKFNQPIWEGWD